MEFHTPSYPDFEEDFSDSFSIGTEPGLCRTSTGSTVDSFMGVPRPCTPTSSLSTPAFYTMPIEQEFDMYPSTYSDMTPPPSSYFPELKKEPTEYTSFEYFPETQGQRGGENMTAISSPNDSMLMGSTHSGYPMPYAHMDLTASFSMEPPPVPPYCDGLPIVGYEEFQSYSHPQSQSQSQWVWPMDRSTHLFPKQESGQEECPSIITRHRRIQAQRAPALHRVQDGGARVNRRRKPQEPPARRVKHSSMDVKGRSWDVTLVTEEKKPKRHKCEHYPCGASFMRQEHLKRHHRTVHELDRGFKCPFCTEEQHRRRLRQIKVDGFTRSDNFRFHVRIHKKNGGTTRTHYHVLAAPFYQFLQDETTARTGHKGADEERCDIILPFEVIFALLKEARPEYFTFKSPLWSSIFTKSRRHNEAMTLEKAQAIRDKLMSTTPIMV